MSRDRSASGATSPLTTAANLSRLRLVTAELGTRVSSRKEAGDVQIEVEWTVAPPKHGVHGSVHWLSAVVEFRVAIRSARGAGESPVVWVHPTFEAHYHFPATVEPTLEQLKEFAETNVVFNLWPYVREFVQSSTARMDLPALIIPLRRFSGIIGGDKESLKTKTLERSEDTDAQPRSPRRSSQRLKSRS